MIKGFKILEFKDVQIPMEKLHKMGWETGSYVGFPSFEKHYNVLAGSCTDWIGYPQSGKTELCLEVLLNLSKFESHTSLIYAPDMGTSLYILVKLIHKHTGYTFNKKYPNFIEITEAYKASNHLLHHFKILHRTEAKARLTPIEFWEFANELSKEEKLNHAMIDSWKDMYHDYKAHGGSYAQYLSNVLPVRNEIAEESGLHFHTIVHPKNPTRDKNRKIYAPSVDDIEGGAQWNNSGKSIIAVHRESFDDTVADIYFRKIKPENVGRATSTPVCLNFDYATSRYCYPDPVTQMKIFAKPKEKELPPLKPLKSYTEPVKDAPF